MKKNYIVFLFLIFILFNTNSHAQWTTATLSSNRVFMAAAAGGDKAIFAGGIGLISVPPPVFDMFTLSSGNWTNGQLSHARTSLAGTSAGSKIFFGGGADDNILSVWDNVDMYDGSTGAWSLMHLSVARTKLAAASAGSKVLFAGGAFDVNGLTYNTVDIYDIDHTKKFHRIAKARKYYDRMLVQYPQYDISLMCRCGQWLIGIKQRFDNIHK